MDEATKEARSEMPWELAYADDLVLTAESEGEVFQKFETWKAALEQRGLKINIEKTKLMVTGRQHSKNVQSGRWPCGCCGSGVGVNSLLCAKCKKWCHLRCSGLKSVKTVQNFCCPVCKRRAESNKDGETRQYDRLIGGVQEFIYLGDMLDCEAGAERAARARVAITWRKWREIAHLLTNKFVPLKYRGGMYETYIRSVLLYSTETWPMTKRVEDILGKCDRKMIRCMAGVKWQDNVSSEEVAKRCGIKEIENKLRQRRLQWFGHVRRENDEGVLRCVENMNIPGKRQVGRPKKTWKDCVQNDLNTLGIDQRDVFDRKRWRQLINGPTPPREGNRDLKR